MELILHLGAHRTASSSLQRLLALNADALRAGHVAVWGPRVTRGGLFRGVMGDPGRRDPMRDIAAHRSAGRVALRRQALEKVGARRLLISDENMLGGLRENLTLARLYPSVAARLDRLQGAIGAPKSVHLMVRAPDAWWTSAFSFLMTRGLPPPDAATLDAVAASTRGWRQVVEDVSAALPNSTLFVGSYEDWGSRPGVVFEHLTSREPVQSGVPVVGASLPVDQLQARLREEGCDATLPRLGGLYAPFTPDQRAEMRAAHADDLAWLAAGADGRAIYRARRATPPRGPDRRGLRHGRRKQTERPQGVGASG